MPAILLVDENGVYRRGIRALIEDADLGRVVESVSFQEGFSGVFDLLLIDFDHFDQHSHQLLQAARARAPQMRLAAMSVSNARSDVLRCLSAGFHGYVDKTQSEAEWLRAITDLLSGRIYVPQWLAKTAHSDTQAHWTVNLELESLSLTRRQRDVLPLLAQGMSTKEIARELNIAVGTAKIHILALLHALGVRNRTEAALVAAKILQSTAPGNGDRLIRFPKTATLRGGSEDSHPAITVLTKI
ncbi:LuxR C-terminal-related transcriptional regulator [Bradyrhizobium sp. TZ2]